MQNLTGRIPSDLMNNLQALTGWKNLLLLGISEDVHEEIFAYWVHLRCRNPSWNYRAIDEEVGQKFGISSRTVQRIKRKMSQVVATTI